MFVCLSAELNPYWTAAEQWAHGHQDHTSNINITSSQTHATSRDGRMEGERVGVTDGEGRIDPQPMAASGTERQ